MKKMGIWIDKEKAHLVLLQQGAESFETLFSELEFFRPTGGSRSKTRWGPQEVVQDSKFLEREKHQLRRYFKAISEKIEQIDALALFGPAKTNEKFEKYLSEARPDLAAKVIKVTRADSMTDNQVKALVRDFYSDNDPLK